MTLEQLQITVRQQIDALSDPQRTRAANEWLISFEKSAEAWTVSEALLQDASTTYRFFGAKFLFSKIQKQLILLDDKQKNSLREMLTQNLLRTAAYFAQDVQVIRYICLALSALALQIGGNNVVQGTLEQLNPLISSNTNALVLFLTVLPEEAHNSQINISPSSRAAFVSQLSESSAQVLQFLATLWAAGQGAPTPDRCRMVKCLANWIDCTSLPLSAVLQHAVFIDSIAALSSSQDEVLEHCVDLLLVVVHRYQSSQMETLLRQVLPHILALQHRWLSLEKKYSTVDAEAVDESFQVEAFSLSKLFAETAEECIEIFFDPREDFGQRTLLSLLLGSCGFPFDHNVARISHKFFYDFALLIKGGEAGDQSKALYGPVYLELVNIIVRQLASTHRSTDESRLDERNDWKELVLDCVDVIGADHCFSALCQLLFREGLQWSDAEAALFAISTIVQQVTDTSLSPVLPQLVELSVSVPAEQLIAQSTSTELLGKLCRWLSLAQFNHLIPRVVHVFMERLVVDRLAVSASLSLIQLCKHSGVACSQVDELLRGLSALPSREVELNLIEAIASTLDTSEEQSRVAVINKILLDVESTIAAAVNASDYKLVSHSLDKVIVMSKTVRDSSLQFHMFSRSWPTLLALLNNNPRESTAEKVCKCLKVFIRGAKAKVLPALPTLAEELVKGFRSFGYSAFLYCTAICISTFSLLDNGQHVPILYTLLWSQSNAFFAKFPDVSAFNDHPDVVEEYFYMVAKVLQFCPGPFVDAREEATMILNAAMMGLQVRHREAQKGMLLVLERLMALPRFFESSQEKCMRAKSIIESFSGSIVGAMVRLISAVWYAYAIDESNGCVSDVLWETKTVLGHEIFEKLLLDAFVSIPAHAIEIANKLEVRNSLSNTKSHREFVSSINRYEDACRRNIY